MNNQEYPTIERMEMAELLRLVKKQTNMITELQNDMMWLKAKIEVIEDNLDMQEGLDRQVNW